MKRFPEGFEFIRQSKRFFQPKTQSTALRALEQGVLPAEAYIFKANEIKPLFEEPYDPMEIERVLARKKIDLPTALLLMHIFEKLIKSPDMELALFAAESINVLENRYNATIQSLKKKLEKSNPPAAAEIRELVNAYFEMGMINSSRPVLKNFYLKEAFLTLKSYWPHLRAKIGDFEQVIGVLLEMRLYDHAKALLMRHLKTRRQHPRLLFLLAKVEFFLKDYLAVTNIMVFLRSTGKLKEKSDILSFWSGEEEHA